MCKGTMVTATNTYTKHGLKKHFCGKVKKCMGLLWSMSNTFQTDGTRCGRCSRGRHDGHGGSSRLAKKQARFSVYCTIQPPSVVL